MKIIALLFLSAQAVVVQAWLACIIILIFSFPCASSGKSEILKLLLSRGAEVDSKSEQGTPLCLAALKGHESTVEVLLEHHADVHHSFFLSLHPA
jgi:ankyrin repeat protein